MQFQSLKLDPSDLGQRLDSVLSQKLNHSRSQIQKWIKSGDVRVNQKNTKANYILQSEDEVYYRINEAKTEMKAEAIPLDILFEDQNQIVLNKAPNIVVHPDDSGHANGTLINAVLAHTGPLKGFGDSQRPGIVHRLDKDTSGVIIIAKTPKQHEILSKAFQDRKVKKKYLALVRGYLKNPNGSIDAPLKRDRNHRQRMSINPQGKHAISHYKVLEEFKDCSLLEVEIETGRTHQIRVHMASLGHPILGDRKYGDKSLNKKFAQKHELKRQFLHAQELTINKKSFVAPLAKDLQSVLDQINPS